MAYPGKEAVSAAAAGRQCGSAAGYEGVPPQDEALVLRMGHPDYLAGADGTGGMAVAAAVRQSL